jgi:hypothetical protein
MRREGDSLSAEGVIADEDGAPVSHRTIAKETRECSALARAIGVWASLVLDEEVARALPPAPPPSTGNTASNPEVTVWPAPAAPEAPSPEQAVFLKNPEERRSVEIGVGGSYMYGALGDSGPAIGGVHLFAVAEVDGGWFLRPTLALGTSTKDVASSSDLIAVWSAARFDACRRLPGNYIERRGIQMDLCGGAEAGLLAVGSVLQPLVAPGATLAMRGELASELSAEVRGLVGVNLLRDAHTVAPGTIIQPILVYARLEMGLSWRFR